MASPPARFVSQHQHPSHRKVYYPRGEGARAQHGVPIPPPSGPSFQTRVCRRCMRLDDIRCDPHLDRAAAACRCADGCPADQRPRLVREDDEGEMCRRPADRFMECTSERGKERLVHVRNAGQRTLQCKQTYKCWQRRIVCSPAFEEPCG